jgi:hypothetical protein
VTDLICVQDKRQGVIFCSIRKEHGHLLDSVVQRQFGVPLESLESNSKDDALSVIEHALRAFRKEQTDLKHAAAQHQMARPVLALDDVHARYVPSLMLLIHSSASHVPMFGCIWCLV